MFYGYKPVEFIRHKLEQCEEFLVYKITQT